ncbi:hypothetical protein [uncultured Microbacterium sp.]|uniref:Uncharacterized protein n=1 Tax=uncultured Microbacterium sp. TaxID=191216 RepID=A0A1Y5NY68_9MICO|nr:hypothetical protein [uncultured Microbacterium sp.]SBS71392.1 membrane hypothetical protein [uncultured Microbacterium sp.]
MGWMTWLLWLLVLAPLIYVLVGTGLIALGVALKQGGHRSSRFVFAAGAGGYVGGLTCLLAFAVDEDAGRMAFSISFFLLTAAWVIGALIAAGRTKGTDAGPAPSDRATSPLRGSAATPGGAG